MAITRTGSVTQFNATTGNTGTQGVTVPADAEIMVFGVTGYPDGGEASYFSGGSVSLNGSAFTAVAGDANNSAFEGSLFYLTLPSTGSQTLSWDWLGAGAITSLGPKGAYAFYKGIDTASPVRDSDGAQAAADPHTTKSLTAVTNDLIVAFGYQFADGFDRTWTWTNATEQQALTLFQDADGSWAEASPTGNQTVSFTSTGSRDGGVCAIVLKPAAVGGGGSAPMFRGA